MINGYLQNGAHEEALTLQSVMFKEDVEPNEITFVCALSSCEKIGALETGACVHQCLMKRGLCRNSRAVRNALLDMYAKCGDMACTSKLFAEVGERDLLTWSIMIWTSAFHGCLEDALDCFQQMKSALYNFICLPPLFSERAGDIHELQSFCSEQHCTMYMKPFKRGVRLKSCMQREYSVELTPKHCTTMVDLYGRADRLVSALRFIESMPISPDFAAWRPLLRM
ncbi:hypothetical protein SAY87_027055 [Trapa incisa]|uniref:Pentatricopeptide repeat-containing protein n=1 Tax=Trapa incisa TaxID=236973 RepID=A0AAN7GMR0_9MYRT|nr:hypothetical protein SAY87_027055 [Trapa incisa]